MKLNVLFFGALTDITGLSKLDLFTDDLDNLELLNAYMVSNYPLLAKQKYKMAVNQVMVEAGQELKDGDEVAFLPPFAGG